jgi:hypothetical protein
VTSLIDLHLGNYGATFLIMVWQALQMTGEMNFHLALRLGEKSKIPFVAKHAGYRANGE